MLSGLFLHIAALLTVSEALIHQSVEDVQELLVDWKLDHVFAETFARQKYDGDVLSVVTKADIDEDFPDVSAFHRRALFSKISEATYIESRRQLKAVDFSGYTAVYVRKDKAAVTMGKKDDVKLWRDADGNLNVAAAKVNFWSEVNFMGDVMVQGKPLGAIGQPKPKPKPAFSVVAKDVCCCGGPHIWIGKKGTKEECSKAVKADKKCKAHSKGQFFSYKDMNPKDSNYKLCGCPTDAKMDCSQAKMWHKQPGITRIYRINKGPAKDPPGPKGCFATLNPYLDSGGSFSEGNLVWDSAKLGDGYNALSTVSLNGRGKTYCEVSVDNKKSSHEHIGVFGRTIGPPWKGSGFRALWRNDGATYVDTKRTSTNLGAFNIKDVIGMAYDDSTRQVRFYKNGKYVGKLTTLGSGQQYFGASSDSSGKGAKYRFNFGASKFKYKPPAGYEGLMCGTNSCKAGYASAPPKWMGGVKPSTKQANAHFSGGYTGINTNHPVTHDGIVSTMYIVHNTGKNSHKKGTAKKDLVNVRTQVWRKVGSKFNLVGESQALTFKKGDNEILRKVKLAKSILVKKGDFFGFYSGNPSSSSGDEGNHVQLWGIRDTSGGSAMYAHGRKKGSGNSFSSGGKVTYRVGGVLDGDVCLK